MTELKKEIIRKSIHFTGLSYIPAYMYFGKDIVALAIVGALCFSIFLEYFRIRYGILSAIAREYEKKSLGAYIYFGIASLLITLFFPKDACFTAIVASVAGDGAGGVVRMVNFKYSNVISFIVMIFIPFSLIFLFSLASPIPSFIACVIGACVERVDKIWKVYIQDNFSVPLATAFAYYSVNYLSS